MKVAYIHGLSRSGSTILQLMLASHPRSLSLGELARVVRNHSEGGRVDPIDAARLRCGLEDQLVSKHPCFCGAEPHNCDFWGGLLPSMPTLSRQQAHQLVLDRCRHEFHCELLIDSSKTTEGLLDFYTAEAGRSPLDVRVIHLVRDFRGWVLSTAKHATVRRQFGSLPWLKQGFLPDCYRWWYANQKGLKRLRTAGFPVLVVSFDRLTLSPEPELERIARFLDLSQPLSLSSADLSNVHELYGNSGVRSNRQQLSLKYDMQWLSDWRPAAYAPLLWPVYRYNQRIYTELGRAPSLPAVDRSRTLTETST